MITMPGFKIAQCHYPTHYHAALIANQTPLLTTHTHKNHMVLVPAQQHVFKFKKDVDIRTQSIITDCKAEWIWPSVRRPKPSFVFFLKLTKSSKCQVKQPKKKFYISLLEGCATIRIYSKFVYDEVSSKEKDTLYLEGSDEETKTRNEVCCL